MCNQASFAVFSWAFRLMLTVIEKRPLRARNWRTTCASEASAPYPTGNSQCERYNQTNW